MIAAGEFVLGQPREDGFTQTSPAWMQDGSFQVFRRLAQDVPGWWAQVIARAQSLPASDGLTADQLAAKLVGRWRSGTPCQPGITGGAIVALALSGAASDGSWKMSVKRPGFGPEMPSAKAEFICPVSSSDFHGNPLSAVAKWEPTGMIAP